MFACRGSLIGVSTPVGFSSLQLWRRVCQDADQGHGEASVNIFIFITLAYKHSRTEFTEEDDENLCQYIAEVLPDKGEGGRTGHFIYTDLIRRASTFYSHRPYFSFPSRPMNLVNTTGRCAIPKMVGASGIAKIAIAWTIGLPRSLKDAHLHSMGKGDTCSGDTGRLTKTLN